MYYSQSKWEAYRIIRLMYLTGYPEWTVKTGVAYGNDKKGDKNMGNVTFYYEKLCKKH